MQCSESPAGIHALGVAQAMQEAMKGAAKAMHKMNAQVGATLAFQGACTRVVSPNFRQKGAPRSLSSPHEQVQLGYDVSHRCRRRVPVADGPVGNEQDPAGV